ncbi:MAG: glycosyltransferase family 4 protein [Deltaproteobacteria bacterium]|nr:glycosyltransferase family 4 protein [Deltaproteobacteria bacterium]
MKGSRRANVLITAVQVPFTRGGAEVLVDGLKRELVKRDFCVDVVSLPFSAQPKELLLDQLFLWRSLQLGAFAGRKVDLVISTKFPSYLINHPNKVVWLVHQHRQLYDLYGSYFGDFSADPHDENLRRMLIEADLAALRECQRIFAISDNVGERVKRYLSLDSTTMMPPLPLGDRYRSDNADNYILSVGRICSIKRVDKLIKALPQIDSQLKAIIVGTSDEPSIDAYLKSEIDRHHLWERVQLMGRVSDEELLSLYSRAYAIYYAPYDEDYGFVTLESLASGKPVITACDSGGVLGFVSHEENGLVVEPTEESIAVGINRLWQDKELYNRLCNGARSFALQASWDDIIEQLTSTIV